MEKKITQWIADLGDGTYRNPILYADYSDPDVIRVGTDYFMTASSFCNAPGLPVLHSKDLVNWKVINYAIQQIPDDCYEKPIHGCGVFAPSIRYHEGVFYIFFPMPDEGVYVTSTTDPWRTWSEPQHLLKAKGWIDPCPFWDDDGRCYMAAAFAKSRVGFNNILRLVELSPDCSRIIDDGQFIYDGRQDNLHVIEGPKMHKRNGYYYIFIPSGGVKQGLQTVIRSKNIWGPYEARNILEQKDTPVNGPHQGAWVDTVTGEDWFLHFQDVYAAGRIVHLQPMRWLEDGWPVIGAAEEGETCGKPVLSYRKPDVGAEYDMVLPEASDEFETEKLGLQWQWNANWKPEWFEMDQEHSCIRLNAVQKEKECSLSNVPNLLIQKWCMPEFTCEAKMNVSGLKDGDLAGYISMAEIYAGFAVKCAEGKKQLKLFHGRQYYEGRNCIAADEMKDLICLERDDIYFRMKVTRVESEEVNTDGPYTFPVPKELVELFYSPDGNEFEKVYEFTPIAGRWVGVKMGAFCCHEGEGEKGCLSVDYFRITAEE